MADSSSPAQGRASFLPTTIYAICDDDGWVYYTQVTPTRDFGFFRYRSHEIGKICAPLAADVMCRLRPAHAACRRNFAGAVLAAGAVRFKPILLTALSAMIGAATILTDPIFQGLAISLLFGLASSTLLTVLVIPAIYVVLRDPDGLPAGASRPFPKCRPERKKTMSTTVKDLMAAARAAVPAIAPAAAEELVRNAGALVLDVRDGTEVAASGKLKGALAISRGMLEFRADPAVPTYEPALRKDRPVLLYCASGGRAALAAKTLLDMGFTDVRNLGGFKELAEGGWPVEPV